MNNISKLALVAILGITVATGCTQPSKAAATEPVSLRDGNYAVIGEADNNDWVPEMTISINDGKISSIKYDESTPMKKSVDIEYQNSFKTKNDIDLLEIYTALQDRLVKTQDASKLDTITGATITAANFKALAEEALKDAKDGEKYIDGSYTAKGITDERYWTPTLAIVIKDGKIETVKYDEVSSRIFKYKSQDTAYVSQYKNEENIDLAILYDTLQNALIEKQDPAKIDSVAGATATSVNFIDTAKKAIEKAK